MKFIIKDFFSKCDEIRSFLRIWSHLLKKSLMQNFVFCAVKVITKHGLEQFAKLQNWKFHNLCFPQVINLNFSPDVTQASKFFGNDRFGSAEVPQLSSLRN